MNQLVSEHPEIRSEQAYLDAAYDRVEEIRDGARSTMEEVLDLGPGGTFQSRTERDVVVRTALNRLDQLQIGAQPLCFGRTDAVAGDRYYIGRVGVSGRDHEPLIVDWRAPVAEPFYRATGRHPMGLARRRHFSLRGRTLVGLEDEPLDLGANDDLVVSGQGALLAALERTRTGQMTDIVATIQGEQDEVIRAPLPGCLVVQGGPGTGKTAVALHRAAYLLYTYRFPLERLGVLVVGPNPIFLRYISQVLPSLGESGVRMSTISGLLRGVEVREVDAPEVAMLKGDPRMARFIRRAIQNRQRAPKEDVIIVFGAQKLVATAAELREVVAMAKRRGGAHNTRRKLLERLFIDVLYAKHEAAVAREAVREIGAREVDLPTFAEAMLESIDFEVACDRMWPVLHGVELVHDLFGAKPLLRLASQGILKTDEAESLYRPRVANAEDIPWTDGDVALIDEARVLLGPVRPLAEGEVHVPTFGHLVVDEAQELSPMQLRMLSRRSLNGSMTIVGDLAQATGSWAPTRWEAVLKFLEVDEATEVELTIGYRTPSEVMELASTVLARMNLPLTAPRPVRSSGNPPDELVVRRDEQLEAVAEVLSLPFEGTVGLIAVDAERWAEALNARGVPAWNPEESEGRAEEGVTCVSPKLAKGLEYDHVFVIEPDRIEAEYGLGGLYVSLTRTTNRLTLVRESSSVVADSGR